VVVITREKEFKGMWDSGVASSITPICSTNNKIRSPSLKSYVPPAQENPNSAEGMLTLEAEEPALLRFEFLECLVKLAILRYAKGNDRL
jgi:hypothetical protein